MKATYKRLVKLLAEKPQRQYLDIVNFVQARISLVVVRSNTLMRKGQRGNWVLKVRRLVWEFGSGFGLAGVYRT